MKALVFENKVVDVAEVPFEVHSSMTWMDCSSDCEIGWTLESGVLTAPPEPPEKTYAENRRAYYPAIGDQLDDLYHKGAFSDEMKAKIKKVKDDNPKPE